MNDKRQDKEQVTPETAADIAAAGTPAEQNVEVVDEIEVLLAQLAECRHELAESKNAYLRAHADFDNFRKRMRNERDQEFSRGSDRVLADLLPVMDDFERALAAVNENSTVQSLQQGVELIYRHVVTLLDRYSLTAMEVVGKPFDPKYHDAVARIATNDVPEHTVVAEIQKGYLRNGDVFRPARVAVAVPPEE